MKLKYYLRGLGIGIICTAIIMGIALSGNKKETMTDTEIIERARLLGMVMQEDVDKLPETEEGQETSVDNPSRLQDTQSKESDSQKDVSEKQDTQKKQDTTKKEDNSIGKQENDSESQNNQGKKDTNNATDNGSGQPDGNVKQQGTSSKIIRIEIAPGEFSDAVSQKLFQAGLVSDAEAFNKYLTQKGADQTLRVGVYEIPEGSTQDQIIEIFQKQE